MGFFPFFLKRPFVLLLALVFLFGGYRYFRKEADPGSLSPTKVVEAQAVYKGDIKRCVSLRGTVKPRQSTSLFAKAPGVFNIHVAAGERVSKGTVLASVEDGDTEKKYELAQAAEKIARDRYERAIKLHEAHSISDSALEEKKSAWLEAQRAFYDAKIAWEHLKVTAPFEGMVGSFRTPEGSQLHPGDKVATFYDPEALRIEFDVPSSVLVLVKPQAPVGIDGIWYPLTYLEKMIQEETHMAKAYVDILCEGFCDSRAMGTTIDVELCVEEKKDTLIIPFEAIFFQGGQTTVYKVENEAIVSCPVSMGIRYKESVEIVEGLEAGDIIVVRGQSRLYPSMTVEVQRVDRAQ